MEKISILGIPISLVTPQTVIPVIEELLLHKEQVFIATPNPEQIMLAQKDPGFAKILQSTDLNIPDGIGVVWALRRSPIWRTMEGQAVKRQLTINNYELGSKNEAQKSSLFSKEGKARSSREILSGHLTSTNFQLPAFSRVTGIDLMFELCKWASSIKYQVLSIKEKEQRKANNNPFSKTSPFPRGNGLSEVKCQGGLSLQPNLSPKTYNLQPISRIGLLGGASSIASKAATNLKAQIPGLDIIALPYYEFGQKDAEIIKEINDSKINILFVALGAPKQEMFISKLLSSMPNVRIAMGVGGAFDVFAGLLKRPPVFVQQIGLEWLYRLLQEPWRVKRQMKLANYIFKVLLSKSKSEIIQ